MTGPREIGTGPDLRRASAAGVRWTALASAATSAAQLLQMAVLARALSPAAFGVLTMVVVVVGLARSVADLGLSGAVIQRPLITPGELSTLFWTNLAAGCLTALAVVAATPLAAVAFRQPELTGLLPWVALIFVAGAPGQLHQVLLEKELRFGRVAAVEAASAGAGLAAVAALAAAGMGIYAYIWGQLLAAGLRAGMLLASAPVSFVRLHASWRELRGFLHFGLYQVGERSVNYLSANVDFLVVGRFLGAHALGLYSIAYQIAVFPLLRLNPVLTRVAFPVFARRQDDAGALQRGYRELVEGLAFIAMPLMAGLALTAGPLLEVVFGARWAAAAPVLQILALLGIAKMLHNPIGALLLAKGRVRFGFWWNVAVTAANTVCFLAAVRFGVLAVAWAYALLSLVYFGVSTAVLYRLIGLPPARLMESLARPLLHTSVMAAAVGSVALALPGGVAAPARLALLVAVGVGCYAVSWGAFDSPTLRRMAAQLTARPG